MAEQSENMWRIRNVDPEVRKMVRLYAVKRDITVAEALKEIIALALGTTK